MILQLNLASLGSLATPFIKYSSIDLPANDVRESGQGAD